MTDRELFKDIEINHDYLDTQINISVSNFIDEYESYQEKNKFNGEKSEVIASKINNHLKGVLKKGDHIIVSDLEHNAVMRPLFKL